MDELSALLTELGDYRGMVQLYEDQILRGKDMTARAPSSRARSRACGKSSSPTRARPPTPGAASFA